MHEKDLWQMSTAAVYSWKLIIVERPCIWTEKIYSRKLGDNGEAGFSGSVSSSGKQKKRNRLSLFWLRSLPSRMPALAVPCREAPPQLCHGSVIIQVSGQTSSPQMAFPAPLQSPLLYSISFLEVTSVWNCLICMYLLSITLLTRLSALGEQKLGLPSTPTYHQSLECYYLAHARCSTNTEWMNEYPLRSLWRNKWITRWKCLARSWFTVVSLWWFSLLSLGTHFSRTMGLKHYLSLRFKAYLNSAKVTRQGKREREVGGQA